MTTRFALAGAAGALLALAPIAGAQDGDARVAPRPAAPTTVGRVAAADAVAPRPNGTVRVAPAPSYGRYAGHGALVGAGVGLAVGVLAYRNNERKCEGCVGNEAIPVLVSGAGGLLGFATGSLLWFARSTDDRPARATAR